MNQTVTTTTTNQETFKELFFQKFYGVLRWKQLDHVWDRVKDQQDLGWYIYDVSGSIPSDVIVNENLITKIDIIDEHLKQEHDEEYCGIVYVDDLQNPEFIKVFDPKSLGTSCSIAKTPPLPKWIISKVKPVDITEQNTEEKKPKRWLGNLFS